MKTLFKVALICLIIPLWSYAHDGYQHTKSKKLSKRFDVSRTCEVEVDNSFGSVTITTWDQPVVSMEIEVIVSGDNLDRVRERLHDIDVTFQSSDDYIAAETRNIGNNTSSSFWSLFTGKNNNGKVEINYVITMPSTGNIDISNDYGAVIVDRIEGRAKISCDFGRLDIGELLNDSNELKFDYTKKSHIDFIKGGTIRSDFSSIEITKTEKLDVKGDYTTFQIREIDKLDFNGDFSTLEVDQVNYLEGRGDYSTTRLGKVSNRVVMTTDFGSVKVNELLPGFSEARFRSDYTSIEIGYAQDAAFTFDIETEYASIKLDDDSQVRISEKDGSDRRQSGHVNSPSGGVVEVKSSFGSVSLKSR